MPRVDLVLATGPGFPQGSPERRYVLEVMLTPGGMLDEAAWQADPAPWSARRHWPGDDRQGDVQLDPDSGWSLRLDPAEGPDPEAHNAPLHAMLRNVGQLRPGEYVTIRETNGVEYAYRVVNVA
jgi:hypothetical protein